MPYTLSFAISHHIKQLICTGSFLAFLCLPQLSLARVTTNACNNQESIDAHPKLVAAAKQYHPYLTLGGAKYFNQNSQGAGIYDLFLPLCQTNEQLVFTDLRIFDRSGSSFEGNAHLGFRRLAEMRQQMWGIYAAFDRKKSNYSNWFNQLVLGGEYWHKSWFIGGNLYKPIGVTTKATGIITAGSPSYAITGRNINHLTITETISIAKQYEKALPGMDAELGYAATPNLTWYLGGYYFAASDAATIAGPKLRATYDYRPVTGSILGLLDSISFEAGVQHDKPRGYSAYLGIRLKVGLTPLAKNHISGFARHMIELVRRDPDLIVGQGPTKLELAARQGYIVLKEGEQRPYRMWAQEELVTYKELLLKELGLAPDSSYAEIKKLRRKFAYDNHPDRHHDEERKNQATKIFEEKWDNLVALEKVTKLLTQYNNEPMGFNTLSLYRSSRENDGEYSATRQNTIPTPHTTPVTSTPEVNAKQIGDQNYINKESSLPLTIDVASYNPRESYLDKELKRERGSAIWQNIKWLYMHPKMVIGTMVTAIVGNWAGRYLFPKQEAIEPLNSLLNSNTQPFSRADRGKSKLPRVNHHPFRQQKKPKSSNLLSPQPQALVSFTFGTSEAGVLLRSNTQDELEKLTLKLPYGQAQLSVENLEGVHRRGSKRVPAALTFNLATSYETDTNKPSSTPESAAIKAAIERIQNAYDAMIFRRTFAGERLLHSWQLPLTIPYFLQETRIYENTTTASILDEAINLAYQYEEQDIYTLLQLRAQEEGINLDTNIILPPLGDTTNQVVGQLREESFRYTSRVARQEILPTARNILLPLHLSQASHWAGIVIRLNAANQVTQIQYVDSLGLPISTLVASTLRQVYGPHIYIVNVPGLMQTDGTSCGPLVVENLMRLAQGITEQRVVTAAETYTIREQQAELAAMFAPHLRLKQRQAYNLQSFSYTTAANNKILLQLPASALIPPPNPTPQQGSSQPFSQLVTPLLSQMGASMSALMHGGGDDGELQSKQTSKNSPIEDDLSLSFKRLVLEELVEILPQMLKEGNYDAVIRLLIANRQDLKSNEISQELLYLAAKLGYTKLIEVLNKLQLVELNKKNSNGETALHLATLGKQVNVVEVLLKLGADPKIPDASGKISLHLAVDSDSHKSLLITKALLGAMSRENVNVQDSNKNTPLHIAASKEKLLQTRLLIKNGAKREIANAAGKFPIETVNNNKRLKKFLSTEFSDNDASDTDSEDESDYEYDQSLLCQAGKSYTTASTNLIGQLPEGGETINFHEEWIATNGDCGFIGLGTDRETLARTLIEQKNNEVVREAIWEEIAEAILTGEFVPQGVQNIVASFLNSDSAEKLHRYCCHPEVFVAYLNKLQTSRMWLGYQTMLAFARLKHINVYIWHRREYIDNLVLNIKHIDEHPTQEIHLLHTAGFTHFNLLVRASGETASNEEHEYTKDSPRTPTKSTQPKMIDSKHALIAHYRGVHFYPDHFSRLQRGNAKKFLALQQRGILPQTGLFSTATHEVAEVSLEFPSVPHNNEDLTKFIASLEKREEKLLGANIKVSDTMIRLQKSGSVRAILGRGKKSREQYNSRYDEFIQRYVNSYKTFGEDLTKAPNINLYTKKGELNKTYTTTKEKWEILKALGFTNFPLVSTTEEARWALEYATALVNWDKKDTHRPRLTSTAVLTPEYHVDGHPRFPYLGIAYVTLHLPKKLNEKTSTRILALFANNAIDTKSSSPGGHIRSGYVRARERVFIAGIKGKYIKIALLVRVPNFLHPYREFILKKYGMVKEQYEKFKQHLRGYGTLNRNNVMKNQQEFFRTAQQIIEHVIGFYASQLEQRAVALAKASNNKIVYLGVDGEIIASPADIKDFVQENRKNKD